MKFRSRNSLAAIILYMLSLLTVAPVNATLDTLTLTFDSTAIPDTIMCGDTWSESGVEVKLLPSAHAQCNGGACLFVSGPEQLFIIARVEVDLNSVPGSIVSVAVDVMTACALCSFVSLYDSETLVDSVTVAMSGNQTIEFDVLGTPVDRLAIDTCIDVFVQEVRITFENQAVDVAPRSSPARRASLSSARPNPFNPSTTIPFTLASTGFTELQVYNASGRVVRRLLEREVPAGNHLVHWDGRDHLGQLVASGVYMFELSFEGRIEDTRKGVLLK